MDAPPAARLDGLNERFAQLVFALFKERGSRQSTARRLQLTIFTSLLILGANVVSGVVIARALGPTGRGIVTSALLYGPLIAAIGGLGISEALVYQSGRTKETSSAALATALAIGAVQSLVLIVMGLALVPVLVGASSAAVLPPALGYLAIIPLVPLSQYPLATLQGRLRIVEFNLVRATVPVLYTVILLILWLLGHMSVVAALTTSLVCSGVACAMAIVFAGGFSSYRPSLRIARDLLGFGLRSHGGNLANIVVAQLDLLLLTAMVPSRDVGYYAVATSAAMAASLLPAAASLVLFPTFANQPVEATARALTRFLLWGLGGALLLLPGLVVALPWAIAPIYGSGFAIAAPICLILVPGYLLRGTSGMLVAVLRGTGTPMRASAGQIAGLILLAGLLSIGISLRGLIGAAVAVTASALLTSAWLLVAAFRHIGPSRKEALLVWSADLALFWSWIHRRLPVGGPH